MAMRELLRKMGGQRRARGGGNYAYVTARVRAKKTFLLPREDYPKLLARDVHEIARTLQEGEYKDEVDALAGRMSGAELVERATITNLGDTYQEVLSWCKGELETMVRLYLTRYDVYNVKTLLRGKFAGVDAEEIEENLIPAGGLTRDRLGELARLPGLTELVEGLGALEYGRALVDALDGQTEVANLMPLENAVDTLYYTLLTESVVPNTRPKRAFQSFLRREVDLVNLKTLLRLKVEGIADFEDYFLPGGNEVTRDVASAVARAPMEELAQELSGLSFYGDIDGAVRAFVEDRNLNTITTALDQYLMESASGFSHIYPLSILPVIDYILRKYVEVYNLRAISHGKETNLSDETIEELLIL